MAAKDTGTNTLVVTQDPADLLSTHLVAADMNWIAPPREGRCAAKTRYRQADQPCAIAFEERGVRVAFDHPQRAVTPGQHVALYDGDECLGGGRIERVWNAP